MGYIKICREIEKNWLWNEKPFSKGQAWIDLILLAQYHDSKILIKGTLVEQKRGEVHRSVLYLSERWGWSRGKVDRFLKMLENDKMVSIRRTPNDMSITLENYEVYQDTPQQTDSKQTVDGHLTDTRRTHTIKEIKEKNINKEQKHKYGSFKNILLTDAEVEKLKAQIPYYDSLLEEMSCAIEAKGYKYKSHYAAMLNWYKKREQDKPADVPKKMYGENL